MADYLNINVGYAIMPTQVQLTLGDVACFHSPLLSYSGQWEPMEQVDGLVQERCNSSALAMVLRRPSYTKPSKYGQRD